MAYMENKVNFVYVVIFWVQEMTESIPITDMVNSVSKKEYTLGRPITSMDVAQRYQFIRDVHRNFRRSPVHLIIMNGVLWKLPIVVALELMTFASRVYDEDDVAAHIVARDKLVKECKALGDKEIDKYPAELEHKDELYIGMMYYVLIKSQEEAVGNELQLEANIERGKILYDRWRGFEGTTENVFAMMGKTGRAEAVNYLRKLSGSGSRPFVYLITDKRRFSSELHYKDRKAFVTNMGWDKSADEDDYGGNNLGGENTQECLDMMYYQINGGIRKVVENHIERPDNQGGVKWLGLDIFEICEDLITSMIREGMNKEEVYATLKAYAEKHFQLRRGMIYAVWEKDILKLEIFERNVRKTIGAGLNASPMTDGLAWSKKVMRMNA